MAISEIDVLDQMREVAIVGLAASDLVVDGLYHRFRPDNGKTGKKSCWYILWEHTTRSGKRVLNGAFGRGADTYRVRASDSGFSTEDRAELKRAQEAQAREAKQIRQAEAMTAAARASRIWDRLAVTGESPYLEKKQVPPIGLRFRGDTAVVPVRDSAGTLQGLQFLSLDAKLFNTGIEKQGKFHLLGEIKPGRPLCFVEGYATGASIHSATHWAVVVCFDAGNIGPVSDELRKLYPSTPFVFCGDDDRHLSRRLRERLDKIGVPPVEADGKVHVFHVDDKELSVCATWAIAPVAGEKLRSLKLSVRRAGSGNDVREYVLENAGKKSALTAAKKCAGVAVFPAFAAKDADGTDFNDLHLAEGLGIVRAQIVNAIEASKDKNDKSGAGARAASGAKGEQFEGLVAPLLEHFALIYPTTTVWDGLRRQIVRLDALKAAYGEDSVKWWLNDTRRRMVLKDNVVFDPSETCDLKTHINLFDGWPMKPDPKKSCALLLDHLATLCGDDPGLFDWVSRWLAYPLQHPGAKMRTALVVHGEEGTGKNIFFDVVREIYGICGRMVTQLQLQTEYTDWLSRMMFCVADEVVTRQDMKHLKGLLKNLITSPVVNISEKYMPLRVEDNHANFVFLSNDMMPLSLDKGDRRYTVIRYDAVHSREYFIKLGAEVDAGAAAGLYAWLMRVDLKDFTPYTAPYENKARSDLIGLGMPARERFFYEWSRKNAEGEPESLLPDLAFGPARVDDVYQAFVHWCRAKGERYIDTQTTFGTMLGHRMRKGVRRCKPYYYEVIDGRRVAQASDWRGTVCIPADYIEGSEDGFNAAIRAFQDGLELYRKDVRYALAS